SASATLCERIMAPTMAAHSRGILILLIDMGVKESFVRISCDFSATSQWYADSITTRSRSGLKSIGFFPQVAKSPYKRPPSAALLGNHNLSPSRERVRDR